MLRDRGRLACLYRRSVAVVVIASSSRRHRVFLGHHRVVIASRRRAIFEKKSSRGIDASGVDRVSNKLYGDAARGCHHRGNGPDARKRTISISRQRLGVLINEGPRRNRWGYRGGACRSDPDHVSPPRESHQTNGTYRVHIFGRRRYRMMAKKKAAKKPAKKAAKKTSKKK